MKRKIPVFRVRGYVNSGYDSLLEAPELKERVIHEVIIAVKSAIKDKKDSVPLIEVGNSGYYIEINKEHYKPSLESAMNYFEDKEDYDKCVECRDLIKEIE